MSNDFYLLRKRGRGSILYLWVSPPLIVIVVKKLFLHQLFKHIVLVILKFTAAGTASVYCKTTCESSSNRNKGS